ncbi:MAG: hypothetical protein ABI747_01645 [Candidatus Moraniibacteriota bacterium]
MMRLKREGMRLFRKSKTKKLLAGLCFVFVASTLFLFSAHGAQADGGGAIVKWLSEPFAIVIKGLLIAVFTLFSWLASVAVSLFGWAVDPNYVSDFFNRPIVYELWKFVRDFFNLFFILVLLFSAFATIFQVDQYHIRKIFLNILLAALLVNFSFPISRFIIDSANVPMYYFLNNSLVDKTQPKEFLGTFLSASHLTGIIFPKENGKLDAIVDGTEISYILVAVIFMFMLSITLLVLAVMMLVRLIALIVLVIFAPIGFVASIIPGMGGYGKQWWDTFLKYAFFGPAAALMLLISIRFLQGIDDKTQKGGAVFTAMKESASSNLAATDANFITSLMFFGIPIVLLWFTMGLGNKFSVAGASAVTGWGQKVVKGGIMKMSGANAIKRNWDQFSSTRKKRQEEMNKGNLGARLGKTFTKGQEKALGALGLKGAQERVKDMHTKAVYEQADENKKSGISDSDLKLQLMSKDKVKSAAAAISLSERKAIDTTEEFSAALAALGNNTKEISTLFEKTSGGAMKGITGDKYKEIRNSQVVMNNGNLRKQLDTQMAAQGNAKAIVDYEVSLIPAGTTTRDGSDPVEAIIQNTVNKMKSAKDVAKSESLFSDPTYGKYATEAIRAQGARRILAVKKVSAEEGTTVGSRFAEPKAETSASAELATPYPDIDESMFPPKNPKS